MLLKIGHRGARAYETENTIASFGRALAMGANAVELDVRRTGDRVLILSHDDNLKKVYGVDLPVNSSSLQALKQASEDSIATLEEALGFLKGRMQRVLVELKEPGCEEEVLALIGKAGMVRSVIAASFHEPILAALRQKHRSIETGLIYARHRHPVQTARELQVQYLIPLYRFVHTRDIEKAHAEGLKVIVWTINTAAEAQTYIAKGVDGIATDRPDIF